MMMFGIEGILGKDDWWIVMLAVAGTTSGEERSSK